jgi:mediator of RNA polymerase II transcription subunit 16
VILNSQQPAVSLRKLESFTVNKIVINVESIAFDKIICFGYSDGTLEYRDRSSITESYSNDNMEKFSHISRIGFSYSDEEPCELYTRFNITIS